MRGLKRKKLQELIPVVFHLHNLLDSVIIFDERLNLYLQNHVYTLSGILSLIFSFYVNCPFKFTN